MNKPKKSILVLCTGNSARSQMAEGLLRHICGNRFEVFSAGTMPGTVRNEAIRVMGEIGIYIGHHRSKSADEFTGKEIDYVLTVCDNAKEVCPYFPAATQLVHHAFDDPAEVEGDEQERLAAFRRVRNEIKAYIKTDFASVIEYTIE